MLSGGPFRAQEVKRKSLYVQILHENRKITSSRNTGNAVGVVLGPETGVLGNIKPVAPLMPAAKILYGILPVEE